MSRPSHFLVWDLGFSGSIDRNDLIKDLLPGMRPFEGGLATDGSLSDRMYLGHPHSAVPTRISKNSV
jgi:hypothetical protein